MCIWLWSLREKKVNFVHLVTLMFLWLKGLCSVLICCRECVVMAIQKGKYNSLAHRQSTNDTGGHRGGSQIRIFYAQQ